jgi:sugar phosphate permease
VDIVIPFTDFVLMSVPPESLIPMVLMLVTIVIVGFFYYVAEILTMRIMIDVVPTKIRNSVYSLSPTVATLFAIPQIAILGYVLQYIGFPITLSLIGMIALCGVLLIRKGFSYPIPITEERIKAQEQKAAKEAISDSSSDAEEFQ